MKNKNIESLKMKTNTYKCLTNFNIDTTDINTKISKTFSISTSTCLKCCDIFISTLNKNFFQLIFHLYS